MKYYLSAGMTIFLWNAVTAWGQDTKKEVPSFSRTALLDAFQDLRDKTRDMYPAKDFAKANVLSTRGSDKFIDVPHFIGTSPRFSGIPLKNSNGNTDVKLMVKIWAQPLVDRNPVADKVNPAKYRWRPREQFAIFFETAVPVQVAFSQLTENAAGEIVGRQKVFPDLVNYPTSGQTFKPGEAIRFPVDMWLDNDDKDELMEIVMMISDPDKKLPPKPKPKEAAGKGVVFGTEYGEAVNKSIEKARRNGSFQSTASSARGKPLNLIDPDSKVKTRGDADEVAIIAYGPDDEGSVVIRIQKKKDAP